MLTHFQEIVGMALDLSDQEAVKIQSNWPSSVDDLRGVLRQWKEVAGANVPGLQLLTAVNEIWKHRPTDLAEAEGREILYHPIDGSPIPQNAPLDDLSWEILAFLRWANQIGQLSWTDEVTIAREIKEAGSQIKQLPEDRFYAKNRLPYLPTGQIDWSDVVLAQAKAFVIQGPTFIPSHFPIEGLVHLDDSSLLTLLSSIPVLNNQDTRNMLLRGLPARPVGNIRRSSATTTDLNNILYAVEGFGKLDDGRIGINVLIDNAMELVRGTMLAQKLETFRR